PMTVVAFGQVKVKPAMFVASKHEEHQVVPARNASRPPIHSFLRRFHNPLKLFGVVNAVEGGNVVIDLVGGAAQSTARTDMTRFGAGVAVTAGVLAWRVLQAKLHRKSGHRPIAHTL
ncbi:MAG: hypothetical protein ACREP9_12180, partial [Candidatus Dormibacteraceae bacterium]